MELVRCRMCGGDAVPTSHRTSFTNDIKTYSCYCERCNTQIKMFETEPEVVEFWNKLMGITLDELRKFCQGRMPDIGSPCIQCPLINHNSHNMIYCHVAQGYVDLELEEKLVSWRAKRNG